MVGIIVFLFTIIAGSFLFVLLLPVFGVDMKHVENYTNVFNKLALGIGALIAGFAGLKALDILEPKVEKLRKKYPVSKLGIDFDLIKDESNPDHIYIHEKGTNIVDHIYNPKTFRDLNFRTYKDRIKTISKNEFEKLELRDTIRTRL